MRKSTNPGQNLSSHLHPVPILYVLKSNMKSTESRNFFSFRFYTFLDLNWDLEPDNFGFILPPFFSPLLSLLFFPHNLAPRGSQLVWPCISSRDLTLSQIGLGHVRNPLFLPRDRFNAAGYRVDLCAELIEDRKKKKKKGKTLSRKNIITNFPCDDSAKIIFPFKLLPYPKNRDIVNVKIIFIFRIPFCYDFFTKPK